MAGPRKKRYRPRKPLLHIETILAWADAHHTRTGEWPNQYSGPVLDAPDEKWVTVSQCLGRGHRGLPGGSSIARLLEERRGHRNRGNLPPLTEDQIVAWAEAHYARTGKWPTHLSGPALGSRGETWGCIHAALPGGSTLARLLFERRGVRNPGCLPRLTKSQIIAWAKDHRKRTREWPTRDSGEVLAAPGEKWINVNTALYQGHRGLPGGSSVARLLAKYRG